MGTLARGTCRNCGSSKSWDPNGKEPLECGTCTALGERSLLRRIRYFARRREFLSFPVSWGTCINGHVSRPLLVRRFVSPVTGREEAAAFVQCTARTRKGRGRPCGEVYLMFDYRQEAS